MMSGITKIPCNICGELVTPEKLPSHMDSHDMPYACLLCSRRFRIKCHLGNHIKKWHRVVAPLSVLKASSRGLQCSQGQNMQLSQNKDQVLQLRPLKVKIKRCDHLIPFYTRKIPNNSESIRGSSMNGETQTNNSQTSEEETVATPLPVDPKSFVKMRDIDGAKIFECTECGKTFKQMNMALNHAIVHTAEMPHQCPICSKSFRCKQNLVVHNRIHTGQKPYQCATCSKGFSTWGSLKLHNLTHSDQKSYQCATCSKTFKFGTSLKYHSRIHSDQKPYRCTTCPKTFRSKWNLLSHNRTHSGDKHFQCRDCPKRFKYQSTLREHVKNNHRG